MTNNTNMLPMGEEARWAERHNAEIRRGWQEQEKKDEARLQEARREWEATPDSERVCSVCGLKLSLVDVARITEKPTLQRHHEFCNPFDAEMNSGVAKGLVSLLRSVYGDEEIPLTEFKKVVQVWTKQHGRCAISQIRMSFFIEEKPTTTPTKRPSLVSPLDHAAMQRQSEREHAERKRNGELHSPVIDLDADGNLRLVSRTVHHWREGLTDREFGELIRTLYDRLPELQKKQIMDFKASATSFVRQRSPSY